MIKRGPRNHERLHARNIIHEQAQKRLDETVHAFNHQVENSLKVNAVKIDLYHIERHVGLPCTCYKTNAPIHPGANLPPVVPNKESRTDSASAIFQDEDIFGSSFSDKIMNDDVTIDVGGTGSPDSAIVGVYEEDEDEFHDGVAPGSIKCGICYRTLRQPGFKCYGKQRVLLTTYNIENIKGFLVNSTEAPHTFEKQHKDGYVEFAVSVPKYFDYVKVSIRDNCDILREMPTRADGKRLTVEDLRSKAGHTINVRVSTDTFTHMVFEFDLGVNKIQANIGGENTTLDYDRLVTLSDIPVVLGPEVASVNTGDIICIPDRSLFMKVRDKERKITATQRRLEWVLTTRVLQPTEPLIHMSKGYKLI